MSYWCKINDWNNFSFHTVLTWFASQHAKSVLHHPLSSNFSIFFLSTNKHPSFVKISFLGWMSVSKNEKKIWSEEWSLWEARALPSTTTSSSSLKSTGVHRVIYTFSKPDLLKMITTQFFFISNSMNSFCYKDKVLFKKKPI